MYLSSRYCDPEGTTRCEALVHTIAAHEPYKDFLLEVLQGFFQCFFKVYRGSYEIPCIGQRSRLPEP